MGFPFKVRHVSGVIEQRHDCATIPPENLSAAFSRKCGEFLGALNLQRTCATDQTELLRFKDVLVNAIGVRYR
jgi:hypothetical protein